MQTPGNTTPEDNSNLLTSVVIIISKPEKSFLPAENKFFADFEKGSRLAPDTFHTVYKITEKASGKNYFFKENPTDSPVSELEAVNAAFYRILMPQHVAKTYAVLDEKQTYIGVASEEISGFKPLAQDPLTDKDLDTSFFAKSGVNIKLLEELDEALHTLELKKASTNAFYSQIKEKYTLTEQNLKCYRIQKGLALALTSSYIFYGRRFTSK